MKIEFETEDPVIIDLLRRHGIKVDKEKALLSTLKWKSERIDKSGGRFQYILKNMKAGLCGLIIIDQFGNIIDGKSRAEAAKMLGMTEVPVKHIQR